MEQALQSVIIALVFALSFMAIGWLAPAMYAAYGPSEQFMDVHSFEANNASIGQTSHIACFDRTASTDSAGLIFTELTLISENGDRTQVFSKNQERLVQEGRSTVRISTDIPDSVEPGVYRYERAYEITLANGRVVRTFSYTSDKFHITENGSEPPPC